MDPLKYAHIERERRWLLWDLPEGLEGDVLQIEDRYLHGTRLRLRQVTAADGSVLRKLGHKVRLGEGPEEIACTSFYLEETEWDRLVPLIAARLSKRRTRCRIPGATAAVDEFEGSLTGLVLAEIDGPGQLPVGWPVIREVTIDERYTGAALAKAGTPPE